MEHLLQKQRAGHKTTQESEFSMTLGSWLMISVALVSNMLCAYFLFKDPVMNEVNEDGTAVVSRKFMMIYSVVAIVANIAISFLFAIYFKENTVLFSLKRLFMLAVLWPVGLIDLKTYRIPNRFIILGFGLRFFVLMFELVFETESIVNILLSDVIAALALGLAALLCSICMKNSIGYGDIKLFLVMGVLLGMNGIWSAVFVSLFVAFITSVFLLVSKKKGKKDIIPFAPSIMIGTYISIILTGM